MHKLFAKLGGTIIVNNTQNRMHLDAYNDMRASKISIYNLNSDLENHRETLKIKINKNYDSLKY